MAVTTILFDTNAYAAFKQGKQEAIQIVQLAERLALNSTVLGELFAGFAIGSREDKNRAELQQFLASLRVHVLTIDEETAVYYAEVYRNLRSKGHPIPSNDMWIAASALQHGCALFSYDRHFQVVNGLVVGTTPADFLSA